MFCQLQWREKCLELAGRSPLPKPPWIRSGINSLPWCGLTAKGAALGTSLKSVNRQTSGAKPAREKGGELPAGHPDRKLKARDVFLGDNIRDEHFNYAVFDEIGMSPSSIEAGRAADALSLFEGYVLEQSDAVSAYTQSFLTGPPTWVSIPRERWPRNG